MAGAWVFPSIVPSSALGRDGAVAPSERITIGLIGNGHINTRHREAFLAEKDARIVAVADPVRSRREAYREWVDQAYAGQGCLGYQDFRELLARKDIDAVCIGTPDHWHAVQAIEAMRAGKDVYVEKPLTLTVAEGQAVKDVACTTARVLQTGIQRRSMGSYRRCCELVRNQRIGQLTRIEVGILAINVGVKIGVYFPTEPVPKGFDYDLWLGPATPAPFCSQRVARGNEICYWYYISDYTVGFISGNGVHFVDIAQWGLGDEIKPREVSTLWTRVPGDGLVDDAIAWHAEVFYENGVVMSYSSEGDPHPDGIKFIGTEGWIHISGGGGITASQPSMLKSVIGPNEIHLEASPNPHRNFLDCIKSRQIPVAGPKVGHHCTTTCNLCEISGRLGRKLVWDAASEQFVRDPGANRLLSRSLRLPWHL